MSKREMGGVVPGGLAESREPLRPGEREYATRGALAYELAQRANLEALKTLAAWMRETGAVRAKVEGIELELGPDPKPEPIPEPRGEVAAELCPCGCPRDQHGAAGCLNGCSMDACVGSGQHPAPEEASET